MEAKDALDKLIKKSRVHFYKPIQIAEILYHHRISNLNLDDLESYRNASKRWRDEVSIRLVGRKSTSSQKYQDNIFELNAILPKLISILGKINKKSNGIVETYIYKSLEKKLEIVHEVGKYILNTSPKTFSLLELVALFKENPGLKRSIDKIYEISVYALFSTLVKALKAEVTLELGNIDKEIISDFGKFINTVLGIDTNKTKVTIPAALYRVGVTNAADKGLDMWTNFGPAVQVKHLTLTSEIAEGISEEIYADKIIIVCLDAEKETIKTILNQIGWSEKIQGIITLNDLDSWYKVCLSEKYKDNLGRDLLNYLINEFSLEFPSSEEIKPFLKERGYNNIVLTDEWTINDGHIF
jgi:HaeII restriction endonuclease.